MCIHIPKLTRHNESMKKEARNGVETGYTSKDLPKGKERHNLRLLFVGISGTKDSGNDQYNNCMASFHFLQSAVPPPPVAQPQGIKYAR